jgi:sepiapterin reductase
MQASVKLDNLFEKKTCVVVCGASRGLGECISVTFAKKFPAGSVFILLARDGDALGKVKSKINVECPNQLCVTKVFDQGNTEQKNFDSVFEEIFGANSICVDGFQQAVMVHSAGTLGDITKYCREMEDVETVRLSFDVNVTGAILINTAFLRTFDQTAERVVINISSLAAVQPFSSWSLYCAGLSTFLSVTQVLQCSSLAQTSTSGRTNCPYSG